MDYWKFCVATRLQQINFRDQVAISDLHSGEHSILLHGKRDRWPKGKTESGFNCFDYYWDNIGMKPNTANFEAYPASRGAYLKVR